MTHVGHGGNAFITCFLNHFLNIEMMYLSHKRESVGQKVSSEFQSHPCLLGGFTERETQTCGLCARSGLDHNSIPDYLEVSWIN